MKKIGKVLKSCRSEVPCCFASDSCYKYEKKGNLTRCSSTKCNNTLNNVCFMEFMSLLWKKFQSEFPLKPHCPTYIINHLCEESIISEDMQDQGYTSLSLHYYRVRNKVDPLSSYDKYSRIPRGVIEHEDIVIKVPKNQYAKSINYLLRDNFNTDIPKLPPGVQAIETLVNFLWESNSDSAMVKDSNIKIGDQRKYLYFVDSY